MTDQANTPLPALTTPPNQSGVDRRDFLKRLGLAGAAVPVGAALLTGGAPAIVRAQTATGFNAGDVAILRFLNLAEFVGADLYSQISDLANTAGPFRAALQAIDPFLPFYIFQSARDEISHALWLNAFLSSRGLPTVDVNPFRTLPSSRATGAAQVGRLTNLTMLNVDTSYYNRLRQNFNPDLGPEAPQIATIVGQPAIPVDDSRSALEVQVAAYTATFYIGFQSAGEVGNYGSFQPKVTSPVLSQIFAGITPVEGVHLDFTQAALVNIAGLDAGPNAVFPDLRSRPQFAHKFSPRPTKFIDPSLPNIAVARPGTTELIGAVALVRRLTAANLFLGQSAAFMAQGMELAAAADAAVRNGP